MKTQKSRIDGAKLKRLREELALTIEQLAAETDKRADAEDKRGISAKTIWRLERGGSAHPYTLERLADALSVEPKELLTDSSSADSGLTRHLCDFTEYIEDRTSDFVGRLFVFDAVDAFVRSNECGYFFVRGDPGIGKSSLAAQLIREREYIHHFNIRAEGINTADAFLRNVCAQLIIDHELDYCELPSDVAADDRFFVALLKEAAQHRDPEDKLVIVVDGLDEVDVSALRSEANLLYLPPRLPPGVFFVATARRDPLQLRIECSQTTSDISAESAENMADVEKYLKKAVKRKGIQRYARGHKLSREDFVSNMKGKSEGNFMYLRYVLPEIEKGAYKDLDFDRIPVGLENYYEDHWRRMGMTASSLPKAKLKIVYILCEVVESVSRALIADFGSEDEMTVQNVLDEWVQFLHKHELDGERRFNLYHESFRDFLRRKDIVQAAGISLPEINKMIGDNLYDELYGDG